MDEICVRTRPQRSNGRHNIIVMEKNSTVTIVTGQYYCCSVICLVHAKQYCHCCHCTVLLLFACDPSCTRIARFPKSRVTRPLTNWMRMFHNPQGRKPPLRKFAPGERGRLSVSYRGLKDFRAGLQGKTTIT